MKKKISLKKLDLKINKINDLKAKQITGGKGTKNCAPSSLNCPPPTDAYQGLDTSVAICWC